MGSSDFLPPPSRDFIRVYHLTSAEYALSNIALRRIKVARFGDLNDPFELLSPNFKKRVRQIIRKFKDETNSTTGLLCFSRNWTNPVLWSHYAARHTGICLGFDLRRTLAHRVHYRAERLVAELAEDVDPGALDPGLKKKLLCTKFRHWNYEGEYRVVVQLKEASVEGRNHFLPFGDDLVLAEVILGAHCDLPLPDVRAFVKQCCPDAIAYKARLAFKFFEIVPDEVSLVGLELSEQRYLQLQHAVEKMRHLT
jgi:hypothetical protein